MSRRVGIVLLALVAITVCAMIAIGAERLMSDGGVAGADGAILSVTPTVARTVTTPSPKREDTPTPSASPSPVPQALADVAYVDLDTGRVRPLPRSVRRHTPISGLQVSPDGSRLAFSEGGRIYVASTDGATIAPLTPAMGATTPSWSPDGRRVVYALTDGIGLVDVASRRRVRLLRGEEPIWRPTFGPSGDTVLFTSPLDGHAAMWEVPVAGGEAELLFRGAFGAYSPDGSMIAFRSTAYDGATPTEMTSSQVIVARRDGTSRSLLVPRFSMSQINPLALWPVWSPDGTRLAFQPGIGRDVLIVDVSSDKAIGSVPIGDEWNAAPTWFDDETLIILGGGGS